MKPTKRKQTRLAERAAAARARKARKTLHHPALITVEREFSEEVRAIATWIGVEAKKEHARGWGKRSEERLRARARAKVRDLDLERIGRNADRQNRANVIGVVRRLAGREVARLLEQNKRAKIADATEKIVRVLDAPSEADLISSFVSFNTKLITGLADDEIATIAEIIEKNQGARWEEISGKIAERVEVGENRANLIARDQTVTLNANLTKFRHKSIGVTKYIWAVTEDARARQWHLDLDGRECSYDEPPMGGGTSEDEPGNPGEGINCRCQAIPVIPLFDDLDIYGEEAAE